MPPTNLNFAVSSEGLVCQSELNQLLRFVVLGQVKLGADWLESFVSVKQSFCELCS
jgi:hypothetical protein